MKSIWSNPLIFFENGGMNNGGNGSVVGPGSGQGTPDIEPIDYEMWLVEFEEDPLYGNGSWEDYVKWMTAHGFAEWIDSLNPQPEP